MLFSFLTTPLALATVMLGSSVFAQDIDADEIPAACTAICAPIVSLTTTCNVDMENVADAIEDTLQRECICNNDSFDVAQIAGLCASCISQNGSTTDDLSQLLATCSFSSTSYAASATALISTISVSATRPTATTTGTATMTGTANAANPTGNAAPSRKVGGIEALAAAGLIIAAVV
ncbi:Protein CAP22-like protein 2 [Phlyctema vagabunda]|uniref:Protein CAP22-like protein 2 n=1 Tax=Phlyctema vagabunda TaxID=108571 RepID=A0ABR4PR08_9HELO